MNLRSRLIANDTLLLQGYMKEMIDSRVASGEDTGDLLGNLILSSVDEGGKKLRLETSELMGSGLTKPRFLDFSHKFLV